LYPIRKSNTIYDDRMSIVTHLCIVYVYTASALHCIAIDALCGPPATGTTGQRMSHSEGTACLAASQAGHTRDSQAVPRGNADGCITRLN